MFCFTIESKKEKKKKSERKNNFIDSNLIIDPRYEMLKTINDEIIYRLIT